MITTLNRAPFQQYELVHESHSHRRLTLITDQRINNKDQVLPIT
jgi:hypothetical protein